jgi:hypothetical protein
MLHVFLSRIFCSNWGAVKKTRELVLCFIFMNVFAEPNLANAHSPDSEPQLDKIILFWV